MTLVRQDTSIYENTEAKARLLATLEQLRLGASDHTRTLHRLDQRLERLALEQKQMLELIEFERQLLRMT